MRRMDVGNGFGGFSGWESGEWDGCVGTEKDGYGGMCGHEDC